MIALVDMNCFFAAIEQLDHPDWRNRPVAVTNGILGSTIITCSYEARRYQVKTGMRLNQARQLCPDLIQAPSRPERYAALSTKIMDALISISPDVEIYSVDEAFIELTHCQHLYDSAHDIGQRIKQLVKQVSGGLTCSVGISGDKTTAKFAAKQHKPDGLEVIHPEQSAQALSEQPVTALSGINKGVAQFLATYNVTHCKHMQTLPMSLLAKRYGNVGRRIWLMAQGRDPDPLHINVSEPKSIGHGKNMPPETTDKQVLLTYFQHMAEKVAARLRHFDYWASEFFIALKTQQGWLKQKRRTVVQTNDGYTIYRLCQQFVETYWQGQGVWQVRVVAVDPKKSLQIDLYEDNTAETQRNNLNQAVDKVNDRYGEFTIAPARLLNRSTMPNVIAPAWKPRGHRKTV
jgi:DNA polymerase-4